jgi:hypothetical protein
MVVSFTTVTLVAATPPMVTAVAPVRLVPVIVTVVEPAVEPPDGEILVTVGAGGNGREVALTCAVPLEYPVRVVFTVTVEEVLAATPVTVIIPVLFIVAVPTDADGVYTLIPL